MKTNKVFFFVRYKLSICFVFEHILECDRLHFCKFLLCAKRECHSGLLSTRFFLWFFVCNAFLLSLEVLNHHSMMANHIFLCRDDNMLKHELIWCVDIYVLIVRPHVHTFHQKHHSVRHKRWCILYWLNLLELRAICGKRNKPILLKRKFSATIYEWLNAAEYIALNGNNQIILCERDVRSFNNTIRYVLYLQWVVVAKGLCELPVIIDHSNSGKMRELAKPMSLVSIACGSESLIIEAHLVPENRLSDSKQLIYLNYNKY